MVIGAGAGRRCEHPVIDGPEAPWGFAMLVTIEALVPVLAAGLTRFVRGHRQS